MTLPDFVCNFSRLTNLHLAHNELTMLPMHIGYLSELEILDVSNNDLGSLPDSVAKLDKLTTLNLAGNQIPFLPKFIANLTHLCILDVRNTRMKVPLALANRIESNAVMAGYFK